VALGRAQAETLLDSLRARNLATPTIIMVNGPPTDRNAVDFKHGVHAVLDPLVAQQKLTIAREYDAREYTAASAQASVGEALRSLGNRVDAVYCATDSLSGGCATAVQAASVKPYPLITGMDASVAADQRILVDQQYLTVFKDFKTEAGDAATVAYDLAAGSPVPPTMQPTTVNNGAQDIPALLLTGQVVTKANLRQVVVDSGAVAPAQLCTSTYATVCAAAGIRVS
jgi:D-xylose transport system substrate-binding protein